MPEKTPQTVSENMRQKSETRMPSRHHSRETFREFTWMLAGMLHQNAKTPASRKRASRPRKGATGRPPVCRSRSASVRTGARALKS